MPKSCEAVGCTNHARKLDRKVRFYTFPKRHREAQRRDLWLKAIQRVNRDGSRWSPTRHLVLCSEHFVSGRPNKNPEHVDYVPSVFKRQAGVNTKRTSYQPKRRHINQDMLKSEPVAVMSSSKDDPMDLGPFLKEYVLNNPFTSSPSPPPAPRTPAPVRTLLPARTRTSFLGIKSRPVVVPAQSVPIKLERASPNDTPTWSGGGSALNTAVTTVGQIPVLAVKAIPSPAPIVHQVAPIVQTPTADVAKPANENETPVLLPVPPGGVVDTPKAHIGSNRNFAVMLREMKLPHKHIKIKKWLLSNYRHAVSSPVWLSSDDLLDHAHQLFTDLKSSVLSRIMKVTFPNCHKVINKYGYFYIGLVQRPEKAHYNDESLCQAAEAVASGQLTAEMASQVHGFTTELINRFVVWFDTINDTLPDDDTAEKMNRESDPDWVMSDSESESDDNVASGTSENRSSIRWKLRQKARARLNTKMEPRSLSSSPPLTAASTANISTTHALSSGKPHQHKSADGEWRPPRVQLVDSAGAPGHPRRLSSRLKARTKNKAGGHQKENGGANLVKAEGGTDIEDGEQERADSGPAEGEGTDDSGDFDDFYDDEEEEDDDDEADMDDDDLSNNTQSTPTDGSTTSCVASTAIGSFQVRVKTEPLDPECEEDEQNNNQRPCSKSPPQYGRQKALLKQKEGEGEGANETGNTASFHTLRSLLNESGHAGGGSQKRSRSPQGESPSKVQKCSPGEGSSNGNAPGGSGGSPAGSRSQSLNSVVDLLTMKQELQQTRDLLTAKENESSALERKLAHAHSEIQSLQRTLSIQETTLSDLATEFFELSSSFMKITHKFKQALTDANITRCQHT